eukprot:TRINITY_DN16387_c0_g1_i2.p1 TRINITY_DN16387_c0_g1~~TRINITY_DN16387_c0_g1_i2.p1  ORF type:complete len:264 (+),score=48.96 TRINITY_DN16387_c0_g1_i2:80-871(+)
MREFRGLSVKVKRLRFDFLNARKLPLPMNKTLPFEPPPRDSPNKTPSSFISGEMSGVSDMLRRMNPKLWVNIPLNTKRVLIKCTESPKEAQSKFRPFVINCMLATPCSHRLIPIKVHQKGLGVKMRGRKESVVVPERKSRFLILNLSQKTSLQQICSLVSSRKRRNKRFVHRCSLSSQEANSKSPLSRTHNIETLKESGVRKKRWYDMRPRIIINKYYRENFINKSSGRGSVDILSPRSISLSNHTQAKIRDIQNNLKKHELH